MGKTSGWNHFNKSDMKQIRQMREECYAGLVECKQLSRNLESRLKSIDAQMAKLSMSQKDYVSYQARIEDSEKRSKKVLPEKSGKRHREECIDVRTNVNVIDEIYDIETSRKRMKYVDPSKEVQPAPGEQFQESQQQEREVEEGNIEGAEGEDIEYETAQAAAFLDDLREQELEMEQEPERPIEEVFKQGSQFLDIEEHFGEPESVEQSIAQIHTYSKPPHKVPEESQVQPSAGTAVIISQGQVPKSGVGQLFHISDTEARKFMSSGVVSTQVVPVPQKEKKKGQSVSQEKETLEIEVIEEEDKEDESTDKRPTVYVLESGDIEGDVRKPSSVQIHRGPKTKITPSTRQQLPIPAARTARDTPVALSQRVPGRFYCNNCHANFSRKDRLVDHVKNKCGKAAQKKFKCDRCDNSYVSKSGLTEHVMLIHEQLFMYECEVCQEGFSRRKQFYEHKKTCGK